MANPTAITDQTKLVDMKGLALQVSQIQDTNGVVVAGVAQQANIPVVANSSPATLSASAGDSITLTNMDSGTGNFTLIGLTSTYDATEASNHEKNFWKIGTAINELVTLTSELKDDHATFKTVVDELKTDLNLVITKLVTAGVIAAP